jgi:hypothetical protein
VDPARAPYENLQAADLSRALWDDGEDLRTFAVRGDLNYTSGNDHNFFRFELVCQRPSDFLFTINDPFGQPVFKLAVAGDSVTGLDFSGKTYYAGPLDIDDLPHFTKIPLPPSELLAAISGSLPFRPGVSEAARNFPEDKGDAVFLAYRVSKTEKPVRVTVTGSAPWGNAVGKTIRSIASGPLGDPEYQAVFSGHKPYPRDDRNGETRLFPTSVSLSWRRPENIGVELSYREVSLGFTPPAGTFGLERPQGFKYYPI